MRNTQGCFRKKNSSHTYYAENGNMDVVDSSRLTPDTTATTLGLVMPQ